MDISVPKFKYHLSNPNSEKYRAIEVNGEVVHRIEDTNQFVELFGFTQDMRKQGMLPEEFIWSEYTNRSDFDFTACIQSQIIEYLRVNSRPFLQKYGNQCESWLQSLARVRAGNEKVCANCKIKPFCGN